MVGKIRWICEVLVGVDEGPKVFYLIIIQHFVIFKID